MATRKCKVFIGSSREAAKFAKALQHELRDVADAEVWSQGLFRLGAVTLDDLARAVNGFDFAVFIFAPDDIVKMREKSHAAVRDNVLFELGMFIGKLGALRSFFVMPEGEQEFHLPSDLNGINPAKYDPRKPNSQTAVAPAAFEIGEAIERLGPLQGTGAVLYDSRRDGLQRNLKGVEGYLWKEGNRIEGRAQGALNVGPDGLLTIDRLNELGRFEIHLRPAGPGKPSFEKSVVLPRRILHVSCEVKSEGASRTLRFVAKDEQAQKWLHDDSRTIMPGDWTRVDFDLWVDATKDFLFRIDDEDANASPSKLYIRELMITEERT